MIFGETPLAEAEGAILAHGLRRGDLIFKKGRRLNAEDLACLRDLGVARIVAARLEPGEVHEDAAAAAVAEALLGEGLRASAAFTGRCNLTAAARGLLLVDSARLDRLNLVDESVTVATLPPHAAMEARQMAATVKIIPFAVPGAVLERCLAVAREDGPPLSLAPFAPRRAGLVQTRLPGLKDSLLEKTRAAVDGRLAALDCPPAMETRCAHRAEDVARAIAALRGRGAELVLIAGASAIVDRRDVVPAGIVAAGGQIDHFGMPVDPGNLLLLGHCDTIPVVGLPGCVRSPKLNGFDWVLRRLVAGLAVGRDDIMAMGAGGLLKETAARPLPRAQAIESGAIDSGAIDSGATESKDTAAGATAPSIAAVVLAAGRSTRMGAGNKLLAEVGGRPMLARVLEAVLASQAEPVVCVTGHEREKVEEIARAATGADRLGLVHNPAYRSGLSSSLQRGLAALPDSAEGAVVCLGDMPGVGPAVIDRLIAAFDPVEGRAICLPTWNGKRGNPVLLAGQFFAELQAISGDVGARSLIGDYPEAVCEVAMDDLSDGRSVLQDVDTPEALAALNAGEKQQKKV